MPLNASGQISLGGSTTGQSINIELGYSATAQISLNDAAVRSLLGIASGQIDLNTAHGKANATAYGFTGSTTWTVPKTATFTFYAVGGGAGGSGNMFYGNFYGAGGGSGYYATTSLALTSGESITINIGGAGGGGGGGGTTTVVRSGSTILSASGGSNGGNAYGGSGGSGGGPGPANSNFTSAAGGYNGSNSQPGAGTAGSGQTGQAYGNGNNDKIPPGGCGSYNGTNNAWAGIYGFGAGAQAPGNSNGIAAGGGAGGSAWGQGQFSGASGLVVAYG